MKGGLLKFMVEKDLFNFDEKDKIAIPQFHKFKEPEEFIQGVLIAINTGQYGKQFVIDNNGVTFNIGSYTALKDRIKPEMIGKPIKIVYKGKVKGISGRLYDNFELFVKS